MRDIIKKIVMIFPIIILLLINPYCVIGNSNIKSNFEDHPVSYVYYSYQKMTELLHDLVINHSNIMSISSLGKTYEGRDIWMVKLSDNVSNNEDEPGVLLMGAHHGNEKLSFEVLIFFIKHMVENYTKVNTDNDLDGLVNEDPIDGFDNDEDGLVDEDPSEDRVRDVINNSQIYLIPMVSPDGVEANTRKNRAPNYGPFGYSKEITSYGVNLNRNYGYKWYSFYLRPWRSSLRTSLNDSSYNYRGERPFCENETKAVKQFVEKHDIDISISYHSYGQIVFFPWIYCSKLTKDEILFRSIGRDITNINKYELRGLTHYIFPRYNGALGTSEDWLYGVHRILSFLIELGRTRAPKDPDVVFEICKAHTGVNLYISERALTIKNEKIVYFS